jgi:hypothetical protein
LQLAAVVSPIISSLALSIASINSIKNWLNLFHINISRLGYSKIITMNLSQKIKLI